MLSGISIHQFTYQCTFQRTEIGHGTCLLPGKDVLVEVELKLLVGNVDAELFKRVAAEVLKTKDIQDPHVPQPCGA